MPRILKKSAKESEKRSRRGLFYSSAEQQNAMQKEVNLQDAGKQLLDISTIGNLQVNHVFLQFECFVLYLIAVRQILFIV